MPNLNPSMRLKVNRDTFFLPDPNGGVYFRNNLGSFRMEGNSIDQWVEKLMPMFNGKYTLEYLTDGLPDIYRNHVYGIAEALYRTGFVQDVSRDLPHQLTDTVLKEYALQVEFLDSFVDSGAYRFQVYRQAKVLAVGSGPFFVSLVSALLESGLPKFHVLITDSVPTNHLRLVELVAHARKKDPEVTLETVTLQKEGMNSWRDAVQPFDFILYVSQTDSIDELKVLNTVCREEKKVLLPATILQHVGLAGPLVHPDSEGCWESAWRCINQSALCKDKQLNTFPSTASAMLANVIVFELFKKVTGVTDLEQTNQFFLLNLDTLEGTWHSFTPHPLVTGRAVAKWIQNFDLRIEQSSSRSGPNGLLSYFSQLTSAESGIFHIWEEQDLKQLPLAQCRVQVVNPLSQGPAELLPNIICAGLTHEEARREAGLAGIEMYVSQMVDLLVKTLPPYQEVENIVIEPKEVIGVGAGETIVEGICRALQKCLNEELGRQQDNQKNHVARVRLDTVEDDLCRFYLQALTVIQGEPVIGLGKEVSGFPVVWIGTENCWYGSVGLNITMALQQVLKQAIMKEQNQETCLQTQTLEVSSVLLEEATPFSIAIPKYEATAQLETLQSAMKALKRNRKQLLVFELALESLSKEELEGVFGVLLREEES